MRILLVAFVLTLSACASRPTCAPLPEMGKNEALKDYTVKVINLYNLCAKR